MIRNKSAEIDIKQSKEKCATFARNKIDTYNCYFTETLNDGTNYLPYVDDDTVTPRKCNNGLKAYTISATDDITFSLSGTATTYNVSGITAYANNCGLKYGNTVYAGNGDRVALTLPTTEQNKNYEVNAGTISGSTLTMPAENVTISKFTGGTTGDCTWRLDDNGVLTISGNGAMGNYSSSSTAPWGNNIKSVIIENGVTSIGNYAFRNCDALTNITIPNSVTNIGYFAFSSCGSLTNITIPDSVTSIGSSVFSICENLKSVSFGNGLTSINDFMFSGCENLTTVTMKNNVTSIGKYAFNNCEKLNSINISSAVTTIAENAFYNCKGLTSVTIPASVTSIGENAFYNCNTLTSVTLSEGLKTIDSNAFYNCNALKSVFIPYSVTSIGSRAFGYYDNNNSVNIMKDFKIYGYRGSKAEDYAASGRFTFVRLIRTVSSGTTGDCTWTLDENGLLTISGNGAMGNYTSSSILPWGTDIKSVVIENGVTSIGNYAFLRCTNLTNITIPNSDTSIGNNAFYNCTGLTSVTIGNSVASIGSYAFFNCTSLTSVTIPNSVTSINEGAFGYYYSDDSDYLKTDGFTIYGYKNSAAENYANENGFTFTALDKEVESVDLNKHTLVLGVGQAYTLRPIVTPEGAETTFKWKSSKKDIATVTSLGKVTGRAVGKATVTVTTANGKTYSCTVVVKQAPDNITLNKSEMTLGVGQMYTLQSTLTPSDSATYQQWTSSDKTVAVVNDKGRVTGKKVGTATITVKTTNGHTATCVVTVKKAPTSVALDKTSVTLAVGMKETLTATLTPTNSATYCAWSSSDETVATVTSGGVITAKKAGTATITVKTTNDKTATCTVTVKKAPTALELDKTELSLKVGETYTLKKTLTPSNAYTTYTYTSSKTAVATITSSGKVVAKKAGTAVITITTHNGKTATCTVTVK